MIRLDEILDQVRSYAPDADPAVVRKAWVFASKYHKGQVRKSGEPYFAHPLEVANILAGLRMDVDTIAAACLHDVVEDTDATLADIEQHFGPDIAALVDGVTKLDKLDFRTAEEAQAENLRKLVFAMARDIRVVVIKLADRLHNMQTLDAMKPEKRIRIAQETLDVFAPIANRLGIVSVKLQLEDLAFRHLHPEVYADLGRKVEEKRPWFEAYIERVKGEIEKALLPYQLEAEVTGRVKSLWSIWTKMQEKELTFEEVSDLLAFRILVDSVAQCYGALGAVHGLWGPISERFKDYIAQPKANGYQSLHTTVIGPESVRVEVQIRTLEMHRFAEFGIAAHWKYKEGKLALRKEEIEKYTKIRQLLQWAEDIEDAREFLDVLKIDLYADQVHVYTPKGDIRWFPRGATALDFAYAIHTEVGNHCTGARVNGRMVKLNYQLRAGDSMEILTRPDQQPSKDWVHMVHTSRALSKIRTWLKKEERDRAEELGEKMLDQELRRFERSLKAVLKQDELKRAVDATNQHAAEDLYREIGFGRIEPRKIVALYVDSEKIQAAMEEPRGEEAGTNTLTGLFKRLARRGGSPVRIDGVEGMLTIFAKCCRPLPGDPVLGFITRGRGITVHASDCKQALALPRERRIEVEWDTSHKVPHAARIRVVTVDRPMMLADLTRAIGKMNVNITSAEARTTREERGHIMLEVAVTDAAQLRQVMSDLTRLKGVISVDRMRA